MIASFQSPFCIYGPLSIANNVNNINGCGNGDNDSNCCTLVPVLFSDASADADGGELKAEIVAQPVCFKFSPWESKKIPPQRYGGFSWLEAGG